MPFPGKLGTVCFLWAVAHPDGESAPPLTAEQTGFLEEFVGGAPLFAVVLRGSWNLVNGQSSVPNTALSAPPRQLGVP